VAQRVAEHVHENALEQPRVGSHERQVLGNVDGDATAGPGHGEQGAGNDLVEGDGIELNAERAGL
jgi:hypothetical protein